MRRGGIAAVALAAAAVSVAAGYFGAKHIGESRLRDTLNTLVAGAATIADVQYGEVAFAPLERRATIADIKVSWQATDLTIGRTIVEHIDFGRVEPQHGTIAFQDVTDGGLFNDLLGWTIRGGGDRGLMPRAGDWASARYDLTIAYDYAEESRSLIISKLEWSAPAWGSLVATLDITHLPESFYFPELEGSNGLKGPLAFLKALVEQLPDLGPTLIRGGTLTYRDKGAINRVIEGIAADTPLGDPQLTFLDLRDALKARIATGKAAPWDPVLLEILLGKADLAVGVAPKSPIPLARLLRLPEDAAGTAAALDLKIAASGVRDLGRFAMTEAEERVVRARPLIAAGESHLLLPDVPGKFAALSSFQDALALAPDEPRAVEGRRRAVAALIAEGRKREQALDFEGREGALAVYNETLTRVPDSAEARAARDAVPQHVAAAAIAAAADETQAGADNARRLWWMARGMSPQEPAVAAAAEIVATRLVKQGDAFASFGAYLREDRNDSALTYYGMALELKPDSAAALQALDALAERLKVLVAQQVSAADAMGAAARVAAVENQWPDIAGKADLMTALKVLLTPPPRSTTVSVFNWSDYIGEFTNQRFQEKTGISVDYNVFDSNETLEARLLVGQSGYDVVVPSSHFMARQIPAGLFQRLDKSKLPNLVHLDPVILRANAAADPGNEHAVPYFWGTLGFGYNVAAIKKRLPNAPVDSWRMIFDPNVVAKFKGCGVAILDSPADVLQAALIYLGLDPNTVNPEDYAAAQRVLQAIRPSVRYFHSSSHINDLAAGEICLAISWNGDLAIAQSRADQMRTRVKLRYVVPREGAMVWIDNLAIPADAPHPDAALAYIDELLNPQVAANNANYVRYASPNRTAAEQGLINAEDMNDPSIYPPPAVMARLVGEKPASPELEQLRTRIWTAIKTGE